MMDMNLIAQEVTRELMAEMQLEQALNSPLLSHKNLLFVFNRADICLDNILDQLEKWNTKGNIRLLVPKWAGTVWGLNRFESRGLTVNSLSYTARKSDARTWMSNIDILVIVGINASLLAKISKMKTDDSLPSALIVQALAHNKQVVILDDELAGKSNQPQPQKIQAMGVRLLTTEELPRIFPLPPLPSPTTPSASSLRVYTTPPPQQTMPVDCGGCKKSGQCVSLCTDRIRTMLERGAERVTATLGMHPVPPDIAGMIDHTLLKPETTEPQIRQLCEEARQYHFASVCVNPSWVPLCHQLLQGSGVMVCTVIGFPLGATDTQTKAAETKIAVANGADEIDMVINVGALKSGNDSLVENDIRAVVEAAQGHTVKVILETALLNDSEKVRACELSKKSGAHFVKTSTGFGPGGATEQDIALMRHTVGPSMGVKASGGVRDKEGAEKMIRAGATRIGASSSIGIVTGKKPSGSGKY